MTDWKELRARCFAATDWTYVAVAFGVAARVAQFVANRSLRFDEAQVALTLISRPLSALLEPLERMQAAPVGFLLTETLAVAALGISEQALRLFPLLAGVTALVLFRALATRLLPPAAALFAVTLMATGEDLIWYSSDVKQYSSDVLVTVVLLLLTSKPARTWPWLIAGVAALSFSHPACFVLAPIGALQLIAAWQRRHRMDLARTAGVVLIWMLTFAVWYWMARSISDHGGLREFWQKAFLPLPPVTADQWRWLLVYPVRVFRDPGGMLPAVAGFLVFVAGGYHLWRRQRGLAVLLILPILLALAASALELYPFRGRFLLFYLPPMALTVAIGVQAIAERCHRVPRLAGGVLTIVLLWHPVGSALLYLVQPRWSETELRPVLAQIVAQAEPNDLLFADYEDDPVLLYYHSLLHLDNARLQVSGMPGLAEVTDGTIIARLRQQPEGPRAWFLFTYSRPRDAMLFLRRNPSATERELSEIEDYQEALDQVGACQQRITVPGATAMLYRLR